MDPSHILSKFVSVTQADPGLAQDLLEGQNWNWDAAMKDFKQLQDIGATPRTTPIPQKTPVAHTKSSPISPTKEDGDHNLLTKPAGNTNGSRSPGAPRKLVRGISKANARLVGLTRQEVVEDEQDPATGHHLVETPMYTFVLPDLDAYPIEFREFIQKDLLEMTTMVSLENASRLNWWADTCPRLWPMATTGDGNCLLHAASLGMWGFHDRQLTLRKALYHALTEHKNSPRMQRLKRRWRWQQTQVNKESGLVYSEEEWEEEWKGLLKLASAEPRLLNKGSPPNSGSSPLGTLAEEPESPTALTPPAFDDDEDPLYESLEEFHVYVLANILQRPIIIVADTVLRDADGEAFAPISFGGIYLPLDCQFQNCQKTPLVLTYDAAHFSALVPMERLHDDRIQQQAIIPVTDCNHKVLPIHFAIDPGPNWQWDKDENDNSAPNGKLTLTMAQKLVILKRYINLVIVPIPGLKREISVESSKSENGLHDLHRQISSSSSESERIDARNGKDRKMKKKSSFGQKLKFFSGLEKGGPRKGKMEVGATLSGNSLVEKSPQVSTADIEECSLIVGAKMTERRHQLHDEMIRNYLERASIRYEEEQKLLRLLENESSRHNQQSSRPQQHQHQQQPPRMNALVNPSSQIGNPLRGQIDLPIDSHHAPKREGIPNRYPVHQTDGARLGQPSRGQQVIRQPARQQQPVHHHHQPQVPESIIYVNRQTNPKPVGNNATPRNKGYSPPHQYPPGMRPAPQANITTTDGRMSVPDGRMLAPRSSPGGHSPQPTRGRPVSQPPLSPNSQPYPNYDVTKMQKALPKSEKVSADHRSGAPTKMKGDGGKATAGTKPCRSPDCDFYGTQKTDYFCSKCYQSKAHQVQGKAKKKGGHFWKK